MDLSELPQKIINKYFQTKNITSFLKSKWNKDYKIMSTRFEPYFRILFQDNEFVYKIFHDNIEHQKFSKYKIIDTFNLAIKKDFFKDITIVEKYISFKGKYIGYVYPICNLTNKLKIHKTTNTIRPLKFQPDIFINLYKKIQHNTIKTMIGFTDLYPNNIIEFQGQMYIIDLDSVADLHIITRKILDERYNTLPDYYRMFLIKVIRLKISTV